LGRADVELVARGLAASRSAAQRLIADGAVSRAGGTRIERASQQVGPLDELRVADSDETRFVSRAGAKLAHALAEAGKERHGLGHALRHEGRVAATTQNLPRRDRAFAEAVRSVDDGRAARAIRWHQVRVDHARVLFNDAANKAEVEPPHVAVGKDPAPRRRCERPARQHQHAARVDVEAVDGGRDHTALSQRVGHAERGLAGWLTGEPGRLVDHDD
jgi:ribosomal protein S4